jgi:hypothetical protein
MRYNPATDRAISIDEIAAQCRAAIMKAQAPAPTVEVDPYAEILHFYRWEDDILIAA